MKKLILFFLVCVCILFLFFNAKKTDASKTVIKFASWGSQSEIALLTTLINDFEKQNPNIQVKFLHIPQNYFQKIHLLFASKLSPDVIFMNNYYLPKYVKSNLLIDLTDEIKKDEYFSKAIKCLSVNNRLYAVPRDVSNLVVFYNKTLFDKYKISYPTSNWTFQDYLNISKKFKQNRIWGTSFETNLLFILPYLYSNGVNLFDYDNSGIVNVSNELLESLDFYSNLANKYFVAPSKSDSASLTMAQLFLQQKMAMHVSGRWLVPKYRNEANFDWDVVPFPKGNVGSVVNIDASGYSISSQSKHKKEALLFVDFISSTKSLEKLSSSGLIVPARKDVAYSPAFLDVMQKPKNARVFVDVIESGKVVLVNENYHKILDILNVGLEPLFLGKIKAREVFTDELLNKIKQYAY